MYLYILSCSFTSSTVLNKISILINQSESCSLVSFGNKECRNDRCSALKSFICQQDWLPLIQYSLNPHDPTYVCFYPFPTVFRGRLAQVQLVHGGGHDGATPRKEDDGSERDARGVHANEGHVTRQSRCGIKRLNKTVVTWFLSNMCQSGWVCVWFYTGVVQYTGSYSYFLHSPLKLLSRNILQPLVSAGKYMGGFPRCPSALAV